MTEKPEQEAPQAVLSEDTSARLRQRGTAVSVRVADALANNAGGTIIDAVARLLCPPRGLPTLGDALRKVLLEAGGGITVLEVGSPERRTHVFAYAAPPPEGCGAGRNRYEIWVRPLTAREAVGFRPGSRPEPGWLVLTVALIVADAVCFEIDDITTRPSPPRLHGGPTPA